MTMGDDRAEVSFMNWKKKYLEGDISPRAMEFAQKVQEIYLAAFRAGYQEGFIDATRKETPKQEEQPYGCPPDAA